ncbi:CGNR zinc finger domain-containing protein [Actinokineospora xionganensis]|uniref:CGNR zinc finger domain-containing protein n=1 Tax=Actinokineospora xionganensis TaxID=2684470 RepID=A0ABR7L1L7_9PSEU|nr:CGNR zinc finger domain-containing protein [Actinokineospora xionganensis]MBC6446579.1 CGNR zinc finger domain-containing protein [Actinokineospora xionganensis]
MSSTHDVELVLDFLNTLDVEENADLLDDDLRWHAWLAARGLTAGDPTHVRAVRDGLRGLIGGAPASPPPDADVRVSVVAGVPKVSAPDVAGAVLAAASRLAVLGEWERVKICPADECQWAFFDRSRNRSRTWCSMQVCGNREKARAWRERSKSG